MSVTIHSGPGSWEVDDWRELMSAIFRVLAYAIDFRVRGVCRCGCKVATCDYCPWECMP